jgi:hypothetical protein
MKLLRMLFRISFSKERDWHGRAIYSVNLGWFYIILTVALIVKFA